MVGRLALVVVALAVLTTCSGDDRGGAATTVATATATATTTALAVDAVAPAIAAVEATRGGPQRYTEINANVDGVTLFVALDDTTEVAYFFAGGTLQAPGEPGPATAVPFTLEGVDRTVAPALVRQTEERFPGATVTALALVPTGDAGLVWALKSRSPRGGVLNVLYSPAGDLVSVAPQP